jgi:hypothetical protein
VIRSHTSHIRVTYADGASEIMSVYAVNEDISRELGRHTEKPIGKDLQVWL